MHAKPVRNDGRHAASESDRQVVSRPYVPRHAEDGADSRPEGAMPHPRPAGAQTHSRPKGAQQGSHSRPAGAQQSSHSRPAGAQAGTRSCPPGAQPQRRQRPPQHTDLHKEPLKKTAAPVKDGKKKRRKMNAKERIMTVVIIAAAVFLILIMFLHMKIIPAVQYDQFGREVPVRISLMDKFRNWTPFIDVDGDLESKEYSMEQKSEIEGVTDGMIRDGLDLDQIQEGQFTVLFLGTDESRSNTDVMMLAMFDIRGNQIHILQIPRDTFVPGYTTFEAYKINSV